eukprot:GEMP01068944.1.p2 GENE.GEMP01068944.1~~GEMP01068944.1.p2  ORF type:complete len:106 (-),score=2.33 GEMP01068944.1:451-768(-)
MMEFRKRDLMNTRQKRFCFGSIDFLTLTKQKTRTQKQKTKSRKWCVVILLFHHYIWMGKESGKIIKISHIHDDIVEGQWRGNPYAYERRRKNGGVDIYKNRAYKL